MAITWTDVVNLAPELASIPSAAQTAILANVANSVNYAVFGGTSAAGGKGDYAAALLAAHYATLARKNGAAGPLTAERAGEVSRGFGAPLNATRHSSTSYGSAFDELARGCVAARFTVGGYAG